MPKAKGRLDGEHLAILRFVRIAPRKARLVIDQIRGMDADSALQFVSKDPHRSSYFVKKLLTSAIAGALEKNFPSKLYVSTARVDEGPTIKRFRPRARGSAFSIMKRMSHIAIGLKPIEKEE